MEEKQITQALLDRGDWHKRNEPELKRAQARIGETPIEVAKWLLDRFCDTKLSELSAGGRLDLQWETLVFSRGLKPTYTLGVLPSPADVKLEDMQAVTKQLVDTALEPGTVIRHRYRSYSEAFLLLPGYGPVTSQDFDDDADLYFHKIVRALEPFAAKLARCHDCQRVFPRRQDDQAFCSVRCQNRVAARDYRSRAQQGLKADTKKKGGTRHAKKR